MRIYLDEDLSSGLLTKLLQLTPKGIVAAIRKLEAAGMPLDNEYIVLNHWR